MSNTADSTTFGIVEDSTRKRALSISSCDSDPLAYRHVAGTGSSRASSLSGHSSFFDKDSFCGGGESNGSVSDDGEKAGVGVVTEHEPIPQHTNAAPLSSLPGIRKGSPRPGAVGTGASTCGGTQKTAIRARKRIDVEDADIEEFVLKRVGKGNVDASGKQEEGVSAVGAEGDALLTESTKAALAKAAMPMHVPKERISKQPFATIESVIPRSSTVVAVHALRGRVVDCGAYACLADGTVVGAISTLLGAVLSCRYAIVGDSGAFAELLMSGKVAETNYNVEVAKRRIKKAKKQQRLAALQETAEGDNVSNDRAEEKNKQPEEDDNNTCQGGATGSDADVGSDDDDDLESIKSLDSEEEEEQHRRFLAYTPLAIGTPLYYDTEGAVVIYDPMAIAASQKEATDASFVNDDELPTDKRPDFSDDEKEREWKKSQRARLQGRAAGCDDEDDVMPLGHTVPSTANENKKTEKKQGVGADLDQDSDASTVSSSGSEAEFDDEGNMIAYRPKGAPKRNRNIHDAIMDLVSAVTENSSKGPATKPQEGGSALSTVDDANRGESKANADVNSKPDNSNGNATATRNPNLLTTPSGVPILKRGRGSVQSCSFGSQLVANAKPVSHATTNGTVSTNGEPPLIKNSDGIVEGVKKTGIIIRKHNNDENSSPTEEGSAGADAEEDAGERDEAKKKHRAEPTSTLSIDFLRIHGHDSILPPTTTHQQQQQQQQNDTSLSSPLAAVNNNTTSNNNCTNSNNSSLSSLPSIRVGRTLLSIVATPQGGTYSQDQHEFINTSSGSISHYDTAFTTGGNGRNHNGGAGGGRKYGNEGGRRHDNATANTDRANANSSASVYPTTSTTSANAPPTMHVSPLGGVGAGASPTTSSSSTIAQMQPMPTAYGPYSTPNSVVMPFAPPMLGGVGAGLAPGIAASSATLVAVGGQVPELTASVAPNQLQLQQQQQQMMLMAQQQQQYQLMLAYQQQMAAAAQQQQMQPAQHMALPIMSPSDQQQQMMMTGGMGMGMGVTPSASPSNSTLVAQYPTQHVSTTTAGPSTKAADNITAAPPSTVPSPSSGGGQAGGGAYVDQLLASLSQQQQQMALMAQQLQLLQSGMGMGMSPIGMGMPSTCMMPSMGGMGMPMMAMMGAGAGGIPQQQQQQAQQPLGMPPSPSLPIGASMSPAASPSFSELSAMQQQANAHAHANTHQMMFMQQHQQPPTHQELHQQQHQQQMIVGGLGMSLPTFPNAMLERQP